MDSESKEQVRQIVREIWANAERIHSGMLELTIEFEYGQVVDKQFRAYSLTRQIRSLMSRQPDPACRQDLEGLLQVYGQRNDHNHKSGDR